MAPAVFQATEDSPGQSQRQAIDRLAQRVVQLDLGLVATLFIESVRPLNFVGSQLMHFFSPFIHAFGQFPDYDALSTLLEDRRCVDALLEAIEREEAARESAARK